MEKVCGMVMFPGLTQLDLTGPYEVFCRVTGMRVVLFSVDGKAVRTEHGMTLGADGAFADAGQVDVLCVPGGPGVNEAMVDDRYVEFIRKAGQSAEWVTSVCTGSLVLGAAGLLRGYRATTHWASVGFLERFGAVGVGDERVVVDRNRVTAAGVSAGIDFALVVTAKMFGEEAAMGVQLGIEYDPAPVFRAGHPRNAPEAVRAGAEKRLEETIRKRAGLVERAAGRMGMLT